MVVDPSVVTLAYRRVDGTELSTGAFILTHAGGVAYLENFESVAYVDMMKKLAKHLVANPDAGAAIQRIDRPGLVTLPLADDEVALFRTDPAEAIRQRMIPPQVVHIGVDKSRDAVVHPLEAGYETFAECFGDVVYAKVKTRSEGQQVECFCCGAWAPVQKINDTRHGYTCVECGAWFAFDDFQPEAGWSGVRTRILLDVSTSQYFLPRRWNNGKNWISRTDLMNKYDDYLKEKPR